MSSAETAMIIGLDFGSHTTSIAIYNEDQNTVDCIADDLGSRTIPCAVAYRAMGSGNDIEIIVGQSAISQQHKNPKNTFDDVRSFFLKAGGPKTVSVPVLDKEVTIEELGSHFFRNVHNQVKQQLGKVVRDCIVSLPPLDSAEEEGIKKRIVDSAQAGGIRIKSFIVDSTAALLAYNLDDVSSGTVVGTTLHLDVGWSQCQTSLYNISGGLFIPLASDKSADTCGTVFVKALVEFCAKDFTRKTKCQFPEYASNNKAVIRLKRECENAMKSLAIGEFTDA
jgi:heat shock 70kDa protein 1/2/6/8